MQYLLLICAADYDDPTEGEQARRRDAFVRAETVMEARGVLIDKRRLMPTFSATSVRLVGGERLIADGPFAATNEQIAGYYLVECDNLDDAIEAAAEVPAPAYSAVEIRPVWQP